MAACVLSSHHLPNSLLKIPNIHTEEESVWRVWFMCTRKLCWVGFVGWVLKSDECWWCSEWRKQEVLPCSQPPVSFSWCCLHYAESAECSCSCLDPRTESSLICLWLTTEEENKPYITNVPLSAWNNKTNIVFLTLIHVLHQWRPRKSKLSWKRRASPLFFPTRLRWHFIIIRAVGCLSPGSNSSSPLRRLLADASDYCNFLWMLIGILLLPQLWK